MVKILYDNLESLRHTMNRVELENLWRLSPREERFFLAEDFDKYLCGLAGLGGVGGSVFKLEINENFNPDSGEEMYKVSESDYFNLKYLKVAITNYCKSRGLAYEWVEENMTEQLMFFGTLPTTWGNLYYLCIDNAIGKHRADEIYDYDDDYDCD